MPEPRAALAEGMGFRVVRGDPVADEARILGLWRHGLAQHDKPAEKLRWYYREHPVGTPQVFFLQHEGTEEPVGMAALATRVLRHNGADVEAGFLLDFVVVPEHRGFFPALMLQRAVRDTGLAHHPFLFAMPNKQSEAVTRRLAYRSVGDVVRYARVTRAAGLLVRVMPGWAASAVGAVADPGMRLVERLAGRRGGGGMALVDEPDARFDRLWARCRDQPCVIGVRDSRFLRWRFTRCPFAAYRFATLAAGGGELAAYAACREARGLLAVDDFLVDPGEPGALGRLLDGLLELADTEGARGVSVECLAPEAMIRVLRSRLLLARGRRPAVVASRDPLAPAGAWFLTPAAEDA